jgi:hypothetical protein
MKAMCLGRRELLQLVDCLGGSAKSLKLAGIGMRREQNRRRSDAASAQVAGEGWG